MNKIAQQCKQVLAEHYGSSFAGLILYGSIARNDARPESDINLLVLRKPPFDFFRELKEIVDLLYPLQLESDRLISAEPAVVDEYETGALRLYENVKLEGISV